MVVRSVGGTITCNTSQWVISIVRADKRVSGENTEILSAHLSEICIRFSLLNVILVREVDHVHYKICFGVGDRWM